MLSVAGIALIILASAELAKAQGLLYFVNSTGDGGLVGSNTVCDDGTGQCTLRAAIQASNSHVGTDGIRFSLPAASVINLTQALPAVSEQSASSPPPAR